MPRSFSSSSVTPATVEAEEFELASPPRQAHRRTIGSQSTANLADLGDSPTRTTRGLSIHQLARQPTSLLFSHFHSPTSARRALPLNFTSEDEPPRPARSGGAGRTVGETEEEEVSRRASGVLHGLGMDDETWDIARAMKSNWKRKVFLLMEEPKSSEEALMVHWGVTFLIVFS